jgi:hypothetical protein
VAAAPKNPGHADGFVQEIFGNSFSQFDDFPDNFMSWNKGALDEFGKRRPVSADEMQIRMADSAGSHLQKDFTFLRNRTGNVFEYERLAKFVKNCCEQSTPSQLPYVTCITSRDTSIV